MFPTFKTDRLLLRKIVNSDIGHIFKGLSDPDVIRYYGVSFMTLEGTMRDCEFKDNKFISLDIYSIITAS